MSYTMGGKEWCEFNDKLTTVRKSRDSVLLKIKKFNETSPPSDLSDEKRRLDHWTSQVAQHRHGIDKKIYNCNEVIRQALARIEQVRIQQEEIITYAKNKILQAQTREEGNIQLYKSYIAEAEALKESQSTRPYIELKKAENDLKLKENYKPKELHKLEIDLEDIEKKISSMENILGIEKIVEKKQSKKSDPPPPPPLPPTPSDPPPTPSLPPAPPPAPPQENYSNNFDNQPKILMTTKRVKKQIL